jgi:hypothetical protein
MTQAHALTCVIATTSLRAHFHDSLRASASQRGAGVTDDAIHYVVEMLLRFVHTSQLFDPDDDSRYVRPLAQYYAEAVARPDPRERGAVLQRLGDVALFVSGIFADSLNRRLVDIDYYVAMGGSAYGHLSQLTRRSRTHASIYNELSERFIAFVDLLADLGANLGRRSDSDVLRLYELWLRTGSERAATRLRELGIEPGNTGASLAWQ